MRRIPYYNWEFTRKPSPDEQEPTFRSDTVARAVKQIEGYVLQQIATRWDEVGEPPQLINLDLQVSWDDSPSDAEWLSMIGISRDDLLGAVTDPALAEREWLVGAPGRTPTGVAVCYWRGALDGAEDMTLAGTSICNLSADTLALTMRHLASGRWSHLAGASRSVLQGRLDADAADAILQLATLGGTL